MRKSDEQKLASAVGVYAATLRDGTAESQNMAWLRLVCTVDGIVDRAVEAGMLRVVDLFRSGQIQGGQPKGASSCRECLRRASSCLG